MADIAIKMIWEEVELHHTLANTEGFPLTSRELEELLHQPISDAIESLTKLLNYYGTTTEIRIQVWEDDYPSFYIRRQRPETEEEYQLRIDRERGLPDEERRRRAAARREMEEGGNASFDSGGEDLFAEAHTREDPRG